MNEKILVIEDDPVISRFINLALKTKGYQPIQAKTGLEGISSFLSDKPSLVLLDLGLPDIDGIEVLTQMRGVSKEIPVIIVSARGKEDEKVKALDSGADDYVTKPFDIGELLARVRVALRHKTGQEPISIFTFKALTIDFVKRKVLLEEKEIHLTPIEFKMLSVLVENQGKVVTHRYLQESIWGYDTTDDYQSLRVFMASIRKKITPSNGEAYVLTEAGVGYRFKEE